MEFRSWLRWVALHAGPRAYLKAAARKGMPLSQILITEAGRVDPRPFVEEIRGHGRLIATPLSWVTADHEYCRAILRNPAFGVADADSIAYPAPIKRLLRASDLRLAANPMEPPSMLMVNPPDHDRYRRPVARTFTPRAIGKLRERVIEVTGDLLNRLEGAARADAMDQFAARLPIDIIATILGMPADMREAGLEWGNSGAVLLDLGIPWKSFRQAIIALREADEFLVEHIRALRREPGDDIFSELVWAGELDDYELRATASLLLGAGFETTVNLIGNGISLLLEHADQRALLRDDPSLWPNAVEEILRYDSPVQQTARVAHEDVEIGGERIAAGEMVVVMLGGANYDPEHFTDPHRFDVTRSNARDHLSFSSGIHACLGASLARMEGEIALRSLFERFPDLRSGGVPTRREQVILRGYEHLPVTLGKPAVRERAIAAGE